MTNAAAAQQAVNEINVMRTNKIIMDFVTGEALAKVAEEMQAEGYTCTAKGVALLAIRHANIDARVQQYVNVGLVGCLMAKYAA